MTETFKLFFRSHGEKSFYPIQLNRDETHVWSWTRIHIFGLDLSSFAHSQHLNWTALSTKTSQDLNHDWLGNPARKFASIHLAARHIAWPNGMPITSMWLTTWLKSQTNAWSICINAGLATYVRESTSKASNAGNYRWRIRKFTVNESALRKKVLCKQHTYTAMLSNFWKKGFALSWVLDASAFEQELAGAKLLYNRQFGSVSSLCKIP